MRGRTNELAVRVALVALGLIWPVVSGAQQRVQVTGEAGLAVPAGQLRHLGILGPRAGVLVGLRLNDRVALYADGHYAHFEGRDLGVPLQPINKGPGLSFWDYTAGVEARVWSPANRWGVNLDLGGGASRFRTADFIYPATTAVQSFDHTYPAAQGMLRLRYSSPDETRLSVFVGAGARVVFTKTADTQALAQLNPDRIQAFSRAITVPMLAGLSVRI